MRSIVPFLLAGLAAAGPLRRDGDIPLFVKLYAPILHLHSQEAYMPSDIGEQLKHTVPQVNGKPVSDKEHTLDDLDELNSQGGENVYLTSKEGIQALPKWFQGVKPDPGGVVRGAKSCAVIVVDKPKTDGGVIDVFYFYFYAYNQGNHVQILADLGEYGDHVGDIEHNMVRFKNGKPEAVWFSQHAFGEAFEYAALERNGDRPVVYVGNGTHANWAKTGPHDHTLQVINLPGDGILTDYSNKGPIYDPIASAYFYKYDLESKAFSAYGSDPVGWLNFDGKFGDDQIGDKVKGQKKLAGNAKYVGGPNGPKFKELERTNVCLKKMKTCTINTAKIA